MEQFSDTPRLKLAALPVNARRGFSEVELPASEDEIRTECRRCLRCDLEWGQQTKKEGEREVQA
jgi:hypothetical protein